MGLRLWVFGTVLLVAGGTALGGRHITAALFAVMFASGILAWTIIEYLMHRLAFHGFAPHWQHHANPIDPVYILAPLWLSLSVASALFGISSFVAGSWPTGASVTSGVVTGYLGYELVHLRIHSAARGGVLLTALRKHHFYHHFASDEVCFGVTSPLWDIMFRSLPRKSRVSSRPEERQTRVTSGARDYFSR